MDLPAGSNRAPPVISAMALWRMPTSLSISKLTDTHLLCGDDRREFVLRKVGVSVQSAADWEHEIVTVGVREFPVLVVTGVHRSLETQLQSSVFIRHRRALHILCSVFRRLRVPPARKPKRYIIHRVQW